jgi:hypothetical protein
MRRTGYRRLVSSAILMLAAVVVLAPGASSRPSSSSGMTTAVASRAPVLTSWSSPYVERDMPQIVQDRNTRAQQALYAEAQAASKLPATAENGCVRSEGYPLGPPRPDVVPRLLGHHVEVYVRFRQFPTSLACRPWMLSVVVYSGRQSSATFKNWVERYRLNGARGRVALMLPFGGRPPYHVLVEAQTITGRRGPRVELPVTCPGTGHPVKGCMRGIQPTLHGALIPTPVFALRGLNRRTLEASFEQVHVDDRRPPVTRAIPIRARCPSMRVCETTYADPAFPRATYRVRYQISGQQVAGCWIASRGEVLGELPYGDAGHGRLLPTGCESWLR